MKTDKEIQRHDRFAKRYLSRFQRFRGLAKKARTDDQRKLYKGLEEMTQKIFVAHQDILQNFKALSEYEGTLEKLKDRRRAMRQRRRKGTNVVKLSRRHNTKMKNGRRRRSTNVRKAA